MGEAQRKRRSHQQMVQAAARCVYCDEQPTTVEHMPPRSMFRNKSRPSGLEFACCENCNAGTSTADQVAGLMARISQDGASGDWMTVEMQSIAQSLRRRAPGFLEELFDETTASRQWIPNRSGLLQRKVIFQPTSPRLAAYLAVFSAKIGMALYRNHVGEPLPSSGGVFSRYFLNAGLSEYAAARAGAGGNFSALEKLIGRQGAKDAKSYKARDDRG